MQAAKQYELHLLCEVPNVELYDYSQGNSKLLERGALGVYELLEPKLIVLRLSDWQYSLDTNVPVMSQQGQVAHQRLFILPKASGQHYALVMSDNADGDIYEYLVSVLSNNSNYVEGVVPKVIQSESKSYASAAYQTDSHEKELGAAPPAKEEAHTTSSQIKSFLSKGGEVIKGGLIGGAKLLQKGIVNAGEYIQTKITKPEPKPVSQSTVQKVKMANVASKGMLVYTQAQVTALLLGAREVGKVIVEEVGKSETGTKVKENKYYPDAKNIVIGTVHGLAAVYEGMYEAMCCVGRGLQEATTGVVKKKYGSDAGEVLNEGMDAVGNVGQMGYAVKKAAYQEAQVLTTTQSVHNENEKKEIAKQ